MTAFPLAGRRVLITRPADQSAALAAALTAAGAEVVRIPTVTIRPTDAVPLHAAIATLEQYDWMVFTSVNGVRIFFDRLQETGRPALPAGIRVAAVGPVTREALVVRGVIPDAVPAKALGATLAAAMGDLAGMRVLLARAAAGREETVAGLRLAGAEVTDLAVYETLAAASTVETRDELHRPIDVVTFTSPLTIEHLARVAGMPITALIANAVIACIGPTTSEAARLAGLSVHIEPAVPTSEALAAAIISHFRRQVDQSMEPAHG